MSIYCKFQKSFGEFKLNIDFEAENETLALIGASGCGKSMTLKCIAGIVKPDFGKIILNGRMLFDSEKKINLSPQKRKVGILFQEYALFPNMTVEHNIRTGCKTNSQNLSQIIEKYHLTGLEKHYPAQLSGGQKQRCAIARMMVSNPEIILLDEPFSALDSFLRWQLEAETTAQIKDFNGTVIIVSHNRDEVYRMCDRATVVANGENEPVRTKEELYFSPQTYADALLTGCKNIIPAHLDNKTVTVQSLGISFVTDIVLKYEVNFIGIRAKKIIPAFMCESNNDFILFNYEIKSVTENVFTYVLMILPENGTEFLRWEIRKQIYDQLSNYPCTAAVAISEIALLK